MITALKHKITYSRITEWGKLIAITGSSQILIQALGFVSGILVIRVLPVHEYALYTLANTMLGTLTLLADGGIATGAMALGGKVWKDKDELGKVLSTGMDLRKKFAVGSLLLSVPILIYLLRHHEASWLMTVLIVLSLIPAFFSALSGSILQIPLKLRQDIKPLQKIQVGVNLARLGMLLLTIFIFPWAYIAVLAAGLPQVWANIQLRKVSLAYADWTYRPDPQVKDAMLGYVKRILPGAVYYSISGQLTIWLISIFGSTESIAQIGALSRLSVVITIFSVMFESVIEPRFARLPNRRKILATRFLQILGLLLGLSFGITWLIWCFPEQILSILGPGYMGMSHELLLIVIGSCTALISGSLYKLSSSRGIIIPPAILISSLIAIQLIFIIYLDLAVLVNVVMVSILTYAYVLIYRIFYFFYRLPRQL